MVCGKCISQRSPMSNVCSLHGFSLPRQTRSNSFCNINCHHYWVELHFPPWHAFHFFSSLFLCVQREFLSVSRFPNLAFLDPTLFFFYHPSLLFFSDLMNHILLPSFIPWTFTNVLCLFQRTFSSVTPHLFLLYSSISSFSFIEPLHFVAIRDIFLLSFIFSLD